MNFRFSSETRKRFRPIFWGLVLVLAAVVLILDGIGISFGYGITPWRIILGVLLLAWLISVIVRLQFADTVIPLALIFLVFEAPLAQALGRTGEKLIPTWTVIIAAVLLTIALNILFKPSHTISINGGPGEDTKTIGSKNLSLDGRTLDGTVIRDHLGSIQIRIKNKRDYIGGGVVTVTDNLGKVVIHLPTEWDLITQTGDNVGNIDIPSHTGNGTKTLTLVLNDNMGSIQVLFDDSESL